MFWFFGLPPLAPNRPLPRAIFDGICDVLCTSSTPQKRAVFLPPGAGRRHTAPPPIAKAKATPHAMRSNMPGIRCLVHRRIYRVSLLWLFNIPGGRIVLNQHHVDVGFDDCQWLQTLCSCFCWYGGFLDVDVDECLYMQMMVKEIAWTIHVYACLWMYC